MALTNYTELKASIADFLNRDDLTAVIPDFITLAESGMNREVRHWRMETRKTAVLDTQYTALPTDFLEPIRMSLNTADTNTLEMVNAFQISNLRAQNLNTTGRPVNFSILDGSIEVFPSPDSNYTLEMLYYQKIDELGSVNTSNWVLSNFPDAYLYGSLVHSSPYLAEDNRIQTWAALYQKAINDINLESERSKTSGSGRRMKIRSY
tara:strand:+ start:4310 stop:4930 length:621 start_codon:yes stop_codon:yes gene_type:complete